MRPLESRLELVEPRLIWRRLFMHSIRTLMNTRIAITFWQAM